MQLIAPTPNANADVIAALQLAGQSMTVETSLGNALTAPGRYTLYLSAPDARLPADPRYALLFENAGVPDAVTGWNELATPQFGQQVRPP